MYVVLMLAGLTSVSKAQELPRRYWIEFRDKGNQSVHAMSAQSLGVSERALWRRSKVLPPDRLIDEADLPVAPEYKARLNTMGIAVVSESRWLNTVSVSGTRELIRMAEQTLPVASTGIMPVFRRRDAPSTDPKLHGLMKTETAASFSYGPSSYQINPMAVPAVHALGINGSGVIIGMNDDGFNDLRTHEALKDIRILAQYDFIQRDTNTAWEQGENASQGSHGTATLSVLGGFVPGKLIGPAFGASFLLSKTELRATETIQELDTYIEGLEWMERQGADIVSTSLGYDDFDPLYTFNPEDIVYALKDGRSSKASLAVAAATRKGVLIVTAMGNEYWLRRDTVFEAKSGLFQWTSIPGATGSIVTPADADSILAAGATFSFGEIATFSSTGPTADGRIKPDVVAPGVGIVAAYSGGADSYYGIGSIGFTQGTSFATPLTAGVAALVLSAHPNLTPMQVREAVMTTTTHPKDSDPSHTTVWPNNYYGWGMVNALDAVLYHGIAAAPRPVITATDSFYIVSTWLLTKSVLMPESLLLSYRVPGAMEYTRVKLHPTGAPNEYAALVRKTDVGPASGGYISVRDAAGKTIRIPSGPADTTFPITPTPESERGYLPTPRVVGIPTTYILYQNYPNPFNTSTNILYDVPHAEEVDLAVFNLLGQRVRTLFAGTAAQGTNLAQWDGRNDAGIPVGTGVFFYRLKTRAGVFPGKMVMLK